MKKKDYWNEIIENPNPFSPSDTARVVDGRLPPDSEEYDWLVSINDAAAPARPKRNNEVRLLIQLPQSVEEWKEFLHTINNERVVVFPHENDVMIQIINNLVNGNELYFVSDSINFSADTCRLENILSGRFDEILKGCLNVPFNFKIENLHNKKVAAVTILDDSFLPGFQALIYSFLKNNPWFSSDFVIVDVGLSSDSKDLIRGLYDKVRFVYPDYKLYENGIKEVQKTGKTPKRLIPSYYKMEIYRLWQYDRIVYIDSDILITGDISYLFNEDIELGINYPRNPTASNFCAGLMVLSNKYLNEALYQKMIAQIPKHGGMVADQNIVYQEFKDNADLFNIPRPYHTTKRHLKSGAAKVENTNLIHFVGAKPWQENVGRSIDRGHEQWEKIWYTYYKESGGKMKIKRLER